MKGENKMKKLVSLLAICLVSLTLLGNSKPFNTGITLTNYPSDSMLKKIVQLNDNDITNEIFILPEEPFDEKEAAKIIERVSVLPSSLLVKIHHHDIQVRLFVGKLTENPTAAHLTGLIPRGYKGKKKWDDVPGIGGGETVLVKIGHSEKGRGHGSVNLELHELAHSVDRIVFNKLRFDPIFLNIWTEEKYSLFQNRTYLISLPEEYFAESFAMFYVDKENRAILKERAPETYEYIKNLK